MTITGDSGTALDALGQIDEDALTRATNAGDRRAAAALLLHAMPRLRSTARSIAGSAMEADELLSAALLATWEKWTRGQGPARNARGYIAQAMRNRLRDEMRALRSRNVALDVRLHEVAVPDETERVHATIDHSVLAAAMTRLTDDQRTLLTDIVIDGRKPHDVGADLGRSPARVSSAVYRAKVALRTSLALECLRRSCSSPDCSGRHEDIAVALGTRGAGSPRARELVTAQRCADCRGGVQWFSSLAGTTAFSRAA